MDSIEKLFRDKLGNFETKAPNNTWEKINERLDKGEFTQDNSSMEYLSASKSSVGSIAIKTASIITGIGGLAIGGYLYFSNPQQKTHTTTNRTTEITSIVKDDYTVVEKNKIEINTKQIKESSNTKENYKNENFEITFEEKEGEIKQPKTIEAKEFEAKQAEILKPEIKEIIQKEDKSENPDKPSTKLLIPNVITPNGDGINDYFYIKNLENYPNNTLLILSSKGEVLYKFKGYDHKFDGMGLPIGTYFYKLSYIDNNQTKEIIGSLTIIR